MDGIGDEKVWNEFVDDYEKIEESGWRGYIDWYLYGYFIDLEVYLKK